MSLAMIALGFFLDRAAAGFPLIKKWFPNVKSDGQKAVMEMAQGHPMVAAAPAEIKTLIVDMLKKAREGASMRMKIVYTFLIQLADTLADTIWDSIFQESVAVDPATVSFGSGQDDFAEVEVTDSDEVDFKDAAKNIKEVASTVEKSTTVKKSKKGQ